MVEAIKKQILETEKRKIAYALKEEIFKKIENFNMSDEQKEMCLKLIVESAKEGMERLGGSSCFK